MQPEDYAEYSKIFDYFSDTDIFPTLKDFVDIVVHSLFPGASVTDIGAGTGIFSKQIHDRLPGIKLSVIEPSQYMMPIARSRLSSDVTFYEELSDTAVPKLGPQDAFIFQRSLYAIYQNREHCEDLFRQLYKKLNPGGFIYIHEFTHKFDLDDMKNYIMQFKQHTPEEYQAFMDKWPTLEASCQRFNDGIDNGDFHLFYPGELDEIAEQAGLSKVYEMNFIYVYRKDRMLVPKRLHY